MQKSLCSGVYENNSMRLMALRSELTTQDGVEDSIQKITVDHAPRDLTCGARVRPQFQVVLSPYTQATLGGIELRIVSIFPPAFRPNIVPRS